MNQLNNLANENSGLFWLILVGIQIILLILIISQRFQISKVKKHQKLLLTGTEGLNLEEILEKHINRVEVVHEDLKKIQKNNDQLISELKDCIQRVGLVRFSAFENTGSDLSFSLALLDEKKNGIIISSLYGREESRTYAKSVKKGVSGYQLSEEEKKALAMALERPIR